MRKASNRGNHKKKGAPSRRKAASVRGFVSLTVCALVVLAAAAFIKISGVSGEGEVQAASEQTESQIVSDQEERQTTGTGSAEYELPTGIAGVASGVNSTPSAGTTVNRFGTSCEDVMVGQRTSRVSDSATKLNVSESMQSVVNAFDSKAVTLASSARLMSDDDYENLLHIVEAEAGTEDVKGRILVANVIMNRVKYSEFPDTVSDVIWQYINGVAQFSPVSDGRISEVTVSDKTREAVKQVLNGTDYSEGALFFIQKSAAEKGNISWFDKNLKKLFKYGVHEFYTYPDAAEDSSSTSQTGGAALKADASSTDSSEIVQMAKVE